MSHRARDEGKHDPERPPGPPLGGLLCRVGYTGTPPRCHLERSAATGEPSPRFGEIGRRLAARERKQAARRSPAKAPSPRRDTAAPEPHAAAQRRRHPWYLPDVDEALGSPEAAEPGEEAFSSPLEEPLESPPLTRTVEKTLERAQGSRSPAMAQPSLPTSGFEVRAGSPAMRSKKLRARMAPHERGWVQHDDAACSFFRGPLAWIRRKLSCTAAPEGGTTACARGGVGLAAVRRAPVAA